MAGIQSGSTGLSGEYFIDLMKDAKLKVKHYKTRGIITVTSMNNTTFLNRWDKIK